MSDFKHVQNSANGVGTFFPTVIRIQQCQATFHDSFTGKIQNVLDLIEDPKQPFGRVLSGSIVGANEVNDAGGSKVLQDMPKRNPTILPFAKPVAQPT